MVFNYIFIDFKKNKRNIYYCLFSFYNFIVCDVFSFLCHIDKVRILSNEHCVGIIERDMHWKSVVDSKNADCVSQMMSYALARSVANGMRNADSKTYQPKIPMSQLLEEMNSIKNSFQKESGPEKE